CLIESRYSSLIFYPFDLFHVDTQRSEPTFLESASNIDDSILRPMLCSVSIPLNTLNRVITIAQHYRNFTPLTTAFLRDACSVGRRFIQQEHADILVVPVLQHTFSHSHARQDRSGP